MLDVRHIFMQVPVFLVRISVSGKETNFCKSAAETVRTRMILFLCAQTNKQTNKHPVANSHRNVFEQHEAVVLGYYPRQGDDRTQRIEQF